MGTETTPTSRPASSQEGTSRSGSRSSTQKEPAFDASTASKNIPSPLLTSSLHSRNSATSAQESAYLAKAKLLWWTRFVLVLLIIATSASAIGCAGHVLRRYDATSFGRARHLPLWPANIDLRPTLAILIPAAIIVAVSFGYLVFSLIPTVSVDAAY